MTIAHVALDLTEQGPPSHPLPWDLTEQVTPPPPDMFKLVQPGIKVHVFFFQEGPEKPTKEEYAVAKFLRFNVPSREGKLVGMTVQYFLGKLSSKM